MAIWNKDTQQFRTNNNVLFEAQCIADKDGNIISSFGSAANVQIAAGLVEGYTDVHKFGIVDGTASNTCTIWTAASNAMTDLYPWDIVPGTVSATSTSNSDTQTIRVEGLDTDYLEVYEDIVLTGTTPTATTTQVFHRVHRAYCLTGPTNTGRINISDTGETRAEIAAGKGQSLMCVYTIPAGKTGYLSSMEASSSKNQSATVSLYMRPLGGAFRVQSTISLFQNLGTINYSVPIKLEEKTDVEIRVQDGTNNTISADFDIILVDNET